MHPVWLFKYRLIDLIVLLDCLYRKLSLSSNAIEKITNLGGLSEYALHAQTHNNSDLFFEGRTMSMRFLTYGDPSFFVCECVCMIIIERIMEFIAVDVWHLCNQQKLSALSRIFCH